MITPIEFRRTLHRTPELSFREHRTADFIIRTLEEAGIACRRVAGTGVLARLAGTGDTQRAVVLRADIDALPIHEACDVAWRSCEEGVMHACGHDIHAAVLYGVLLQLRDTPFEGTVFGLFQPGEECNPGGASLVLAEDPFAGYDVRAVVGEHVEPQLEVGTFGFRAGKYMASSDELRLTVSGRGGHAALRDTIQDTVTAAAEMVCRLTALNSGARILSIGRIIADGATNIIPDRVDMEGTLRTFFEEKRQAAYDEIAAIARETEARHGVTVGCDISRGYPAVENDHELTYLAAAEAEAAGFRVEVLSRRTTAEDFGFYCQRYPALFYRLGVGSAAGRTHSATFNPDEGAIEAGIALMSRLALKFLQS